jgi:cytidylate kinase
MPKEDPRITRFVERQMRNWEIGQRHRPVKEDREPAQAVQFYIAISRELGSQGEKVAETLSDCLGWPKYDREILDYMAEQEDVRRRLYEMLDERQRTWLQQLLDLLEPLGTNASLAREEYFRRLTRAVIAISEKQQAIFVGRGVNFILPRSRGLSVRIVAPFGDRLKRVMEQESLDERAARRRIEEVEFQRAEFLVRYFGHRPYDPRRYDMILNAGSMSIVDMCWLVRQAAERKLGATLACKKTLA